jgi:putative transposase
LMAAVEELAVGIGCTAPACDALGVPRASLYRWRRPRTRPARPRPRSKRSLRPEEQNQVLDVLRSPRFVDKSPAQVWATLLDELIYYCSIRTMYRLLAANGEVKERRNQLRHPNYQKPELLAEAPNEVWSWDITKLRGPAKWTYFYLYVILDIFSRYVVGWMVPHPGLNPLRNRTVA